jgi:hypothetical protein
LAKLAGSAGYRSAISSVTLGCNEAAQLIDGALNKWLPGCLVYVQDDCIKIAWNAALG